MKPPKNISATEILMRKPSGELTAITKEVVNELFVIVTKAEYEAFCKFKSEANSFAKLAKSMFDRGQA